MSLSEQQQIIWNNCVLDLTLPREIDHIEQASMDIRIVLATRYLLIGESTAKEYDFGEILTQVKGDYELTDNEVITALELAEDRISREQT